MIIKHNDAYKLCFIYFIAREPFDPMERLTIKQFFNHECDLFAFDYTDPEINDREHTHEFDELVIVDEGYGVHVLNGSLYFIQEGDVFLVRKTDRHFYNELGTLKLMNILINPNVSFRYLRDLDFIWQQLLVKQDLPFIWLMNKDKEVCIKLAKEIGQIYSQNMSNEMSELLQIEMLFMQIISTILTSQKMSQKNSTQYKIRNLLRYLQQNYFEQIDWQNVSDRFFMSGKTINRQIKDLTGLSPVNYLNRLRVLAGRDRLRQSDDLITEISLSCGFSNSDYFAKCYRKNFGISPSDERKFFS